jgi:hypothetical protein
VQDFGDLDRGAALEHLGVLAVAPVPRLRGHRHLVLLELGEHRLGGAARHDLPKTDSIDRVQGDADGARFPVQELEDVEVDFIGTDQPFLDLRDFSDAVSRMNCFVAYAKAHEVTLPSSNERQKRRKPAPGARAGSRSSLRVQTTTCT